VSATDVAVCEPFGQLLHREPLAVVLDAEFELSVGLDEAKRHLGRLRVPNDVGQELTGRREHELLLRMAGPVARSSFSSRCTPRPAPAHSRDARGGGGCRRVVIAGASRGSSSPPLAPAHLSHELVGRAPWPRNIAGLRARLNALGLPALAQEGTALHIHQHLDLYVDGRRVAVPAGIGIDESQGFISPLHTHDESGVIHVESPDVRTFTLGQFFAVWGLRLTPRCLGGNCATRSKVIRVFVDGKQLRGRSAPAPARGA
jgi:hypothetical protein